MDETIERTEARPTARAESCCGGAPAQTVPQREGAVAEAATCCSGPATNPDVETITEDTSAAGIHELVREKYGRIARESRSCCDTRVVQNPEHLGYTAEQTGTIPEGANLGLGCGNPLAHAKVRAGETVLDLGSGAGIDAFLAASEVGLTGSVLGVDMTPDMIERARFNARRAGFTNVEFRLGQIEKLPVADASVDVIISNCVINLSPDKARVFREALRVLRPGGRLVVSDIVLLRPLPAAVKSSVEAYVGCLAGASLRDEYLQHIRDAGFAQVEVVEERRAGGCETSLASDVDEATFADASQAAVSVKVRAWKR